MTPIANYLHKKLRIDAHYFMRGGFWLTVTQVFLICTGLITTALFAQYLSPNEYGTYRYLIGLAVVLSSFSLTGLAQSMLQATAQKYLAFYNETLRLNFIYNLGITISAIVGAGYYYLNDNLILASGCAAIAIFQPLINTYQYIPIYLQGKKEFKRSTAVQTFKIVFVSISSISALYFSKEILILFLVYLFTNSFANFLSHLLFKPQNTDATPPLVVKKYLNYAKHLSVQNIISSIANRLDAIVVFTQLGAAELAVYSIATIIPEQIKASFKNLASLLLPKYAAHENYKLLKHSVPKRSLQLIIVLTTVTIIYILMAPLLYHIIFPKYSDAAFYSQIYALAFPSFILLIPYSILQAKLAESDLYKVTLYGSLFQIVSLIVLVFSFGVMGAIISKLIYRYFFMVIVYTYFHYNNVLTS